MLAVPPNSPYNYCMMNEKERLNTDQVWEILKNCRIERIKTLWNDESVSIDEMVDDLNEVFDDLKGTSFLSGEWKCTDEIDDQDREIFERIVELA